MIINDLKTNLRSCVEHLNKRKLKFDVANFPCEKILYNLYNIKSNELKKKLKQTLEKLKKKKNFCDICNQEIDKFQPTLLHELDVDQLAVRFIKIQAYCSKCYNIKSFSLLQNELYKMEEGCDIDFSSIYAHYYNVNNLDTRLRFLLQNDINNYFALTVLMKNVSWVYATPHKTFDDFLAYTLDEEKKIKDEILVKKKIIKKKKKKMNRSITKPKAEKNIIKRKKKRNTQTVDVKKKTTKKRQSKIKKSILKEKNYIKKNRSKIVKKKE